MRLLVITIALFLSSCGFTPVYGTKSTSTNLSSIAVNVIPDREGQILRNHLIDVLYTNGYPSSPRYHLKISPVVENSVEIGIDKDDEASRAQLRQQTTMQLIDIDTNAVLLQRDIRATSGYNILSGQFTTFVSEEDARKQALRALADNVMTQLEIYFNQQ